MSNINKDLCPIFFFSIDIRTSEELQVLSDEEFNKLLNEFEYWYDKGLSDYNGFHKNPLNETKYPFINDNINTKITILIYQSLLFANELFCRSTNKYNWKKRNNQYD